MSEMIKVSGKTVEDAITNATIRLGVTSDKIIYNVVEHESRGFLGLGAKDAMIEVRVKEEADYEAERLKKKAEEDAARAAQEAAAARSAEKEETARSAEAEEAVRRAETEEVPARESGIDAEIRSAEKAAPADAASYDEEEKEELPRRRSREIRPLEDPSEAIAKAEGFLRNVYQAMGMEVELVSTYDGEVLNVQMNGDDMGILIGKRGQTLDSLQYLVSLIVNKESPTYVRVKLDTENYRERRKATLENLAKNISVKVKKNRQTVYLEPMNPYERRIIHSALQGDPFVTTYSEGEEPNRKVVVALKKDADLDALERKYGEKRSRGGYRNSRGRGSRGDRRGYRRSERSSYEGMDEVIEPVQIPEPVEEVPEE